LKWRVAADSKQNWILNITVDTSYEDIVTFRAQGKKAGSKNGSDEGVGLQQEAPPRGYNKGNE